MGPARWEAKERVQRVVFWIVGHGLKLQLKLGGHDLEYICFIRGRDSGELDVVASAPWVIQERRDEIHDAAHRLGLPWRQFDTFFELHGLLSPSRLVHGCLDLGQMRVDKVGMVYTGQLFDQKL